MAQVKKFQPGGKLTISGKDYTIDQLNEYMNSGGFSSQERAALAGTIQSIAGGASRTFDRNANSISGEGVTDDFTDFYGSEKRAERNQGKSTRWANRQARRNSDHHIVNSALERLGGIEDYFTKKNVDAKEDNILYKLEDANGFYDKDANGKIIFREGPDNSTNKSRIERILNVLQNGGLDDYNLTQWGGDKTLSGLIDWYSQTDADTKAKYTITALWDRIKKQQLTDLDKEILTKMGMTTFGTPEVVKAEMHPDWKGDQMAAKQAGVYFTKDNDNRWVIKSDNASNQYLNSDWYGGGLDFLTGTDYANGFIGADGKLYTQAEILGGQVYRSDAINRFLSGNNDQYSYKDWYDLANGSVRFKGDRIDLGISEDEYGLTSYNPHNAWNSDWHKYFLGLGDGDEEYFLNDITSSYDNLNGKKIIAYVDPTGAKDLVGIKKLKYAVKNPDGTISTYDSEDALRNAGYIPKNQWWTPASNTFTTHLWDIDNGKYAVAHELLTEGNQKNSILIDRYGNFYVGIQKDGEWQTPRRIYDLNLLNNILKNPSSYNNQDIEKLYNRPKNRTQRIAETALWLHPVSWMPGVATSRIIGDAISEEAINHIVSSDWFASNPEWNKRLLGDKNNIPLEKNGWVISNIKTLPSKFQYGGAIGKSKTNIEEKTSKDARTDISGSHAFIGEGGLTDAEWWQIGSAVGDLAGIAMTFIPGYGNIAGAATGLMATGALFVGDVKKDGFQWGDVGSAALSGLFDVGTLIPGAGTASKIGKTAKVLKSIANPIMKLLSMYGIVNGVQAMTKIVNGEKVTSDDLIDILRGISSTAVGAKILKQQVGDAKLSKRIEDDVLKIKNAKVKTAPEATIGGKEIKITDEELNQYIKGKTKTDVEQFLQNKVKEKLGVDFDEIKHGKDLSKQFGIEYDKGEFDGLQWKKLFKGKGFIGRGESKAKFVPEKSDNGVGTWKHFINPFRRNANLGYDFGLWSNNGGQLKTVSAADYSDARVRVLNREGNLFDRWADQALLDRAYSNPSAFNFKFEDDGVAHPGRVIGIGSNFWRQHAGKGGYARSVKILQPEAVSPSRVIPEFSIKNMPIMIEAPTPEAILHYRHQQAIPIRTAAAHARHQLPETSINMRLLPENDARFRRNYIDLALENDVLGGRYDIPLIPGEAGYVYPGRGRIPGWIGEFVFKDGGKIQYAKNGTKITKHQETSTMPGIPDYLKDVWDEIGGQLYQPTMVDVNNPGSSVNSIVQSAIAANKGDAAKGAAAREDVNVGPAAVKTNYSIDHAANGKNPTKATLYNYSSLGSQKGDKSPGTGLGWKIAGNMLGAGAKAGTALYASKRQMDLVNDMKPFQEQQAPEHSFRYRDPGIDLVYDNAINQQQSYARNFKSSDQAINSAVGLQTADKTAQLELEKGLKKAQLFGEQQAQHQNLLQQESQNRTAVVNRNAERANQMDAYKRQMKGAYIAQNQGIAQGLIGDIAGSGQQATAGKNALAAFDAKNEYSDNMSGLITQYQTGINNGSIAPGTSFDDWAMANHKDKIRDWQRDYLTTQYQYAKKGGRIRPASEQIKIDNEKARHKAIAQLSKQAFELLKMALK